MSDELQRVALTEEDRRRLAAVASAVGKATLGLGLEGIAQFMPVAAVAGALALGWGVSAVMDRSGKRFALVPLDKAEPTSGPTDRNAERYSELARLRRHGKISEEQLIELGHLEDEIRNIPPPPEYAFAFSTLAEDRRAMRESMNRIEVLLRNRE